MKDKKWFCAENPLLEAVTFQPKTRNCPFLTEFKYKTDKEDSVKFIIAYDHDRYVEVLTHEHCVKLIDRAGNETVVTFHSKHKSNQFKLYVQHAVDNKIVYGIFTRPADVPWSQSLNVAQLFGN